MKVEVNEKLLRAICNDLQGVDGFKGKVFACEASESDKKDMEAIIALFLGPGFIEKDIPIYLSDCGMADALIIQEKDTELFRFMFRVDSSGGFGELPSSDYAEDLKSYPPTKSFVQLIDYIAHYLFSSRMAALHDDRQWYRSQETHDLLFEEMDPTEPKEKEKVFSWVDASKELPRKSGKYIVECIGCFKVYQSHNRFEARFNHDEKTGKGTFEVNNQIVVRWLKERVSK
jgi:hypothetical protein